MIHDLIFAALFLAMVITPALVTMRQENEEND
jgi:hypothetical protein